MKIVAIDAYTLNHGDLSWEQINTLGDLVLYDRSVDSEVVDRCKDADIVLTNKVAFNDAILQQLPNLKLIAVTATGINIIDIDAARNKGISVCNVPDYGTDSVAQHTFALILELTNRVGLHADSVARGDWQVCKDFSYALSPLIELKDKILGLVGFGSIGKKTAEIAAAFGMRVIYHTPSEKTTDLAEYAELEDLFATSDFISLHLPLKADNKEFVNKALISKMKATAFLINTSRGQLINEQDLADALNSKTIAGAAIDVLSAEPPPVTNPLLTAKNCMITPHNAWMSREARERIMAITFQNIQAYINGATINKVT
ncbi:D-2-hydroxyacid dehydrogenase [Paradesertivirga mongoliensis]|uniref:D-2-hydroxyacid dehydrogenase n=1 Tax=Paradesertivirga mongoliensis TaxID=2100740 RepID=A0ABW4ZPW2_9SPHI|nr:D-2-hydroxyacid dehydrogenase [Pedobacter mongoliensis]